ncbi:MAG: methyltransferase family protein [Terriglobales bacterium]
MYIFHIDAATMIVLLSWAIVFSVYLVLGFTNKRTRVRDRFLSRLWYNAATVLSYLLMFYPGPFGSLLGKAWIQRGVVEESLGAALAVLGGAIAIWARLSLGRNWSMVVTVKENHRLVQAGPYTWIRHPIYTGLITAMTGTALINRRCSGILALLLMATAFFIKSRIEERFMRRTFGQQYDEYCANSGAFLPRL